MARIDDQLKTFDNDKLSRLYKITQDKHQDLVGRVQNLQDFRNNGNTEDDAKLIGANREDRSKYTANLDHIERCMLKIGEHLHRRGLMYNM